MATKLNLVPKRQKKISTEPVETVVEASQSEKQVDIQVETREDTQAPIEPEEDRDYYKPDFVDKSAKDEWTGRNVFVGFPCYKQTNPVTAWCLVAMALDFGPEKIRFDMEIGDAMIYHARNRLAMKFLETEAEWLLFLDDDMIVPIGRSNFLMQMARLPDSYSQEAASLNTVRRLIQHRQELVGATYFARHPGGRTINSLWQDQTYLERAQSFGNYCMPCDWVGTGCLLIHRNVFKKMMFSFPELAPTSADMPWNFFQPMTDGRGEDIAFCARAREVGIQPYVDTQLQAIHVGYGTYGVHTAFRQGLL
jgi:hypothetical protein